MDMTYRNILDVFYTPFKKNKVVQIGSQQIKICYYCDEIATGDDHVPSLKQCRDIYNECGVEGLCQAHPVTVYCCAICNSKILDKPLLTPDERREFIQQHKHLWENDIKIKRGRKRAADNRHGFYASLSIERIADAIIIWQDKGNFGAIRNLSAFLREIMDDWVELNGGRRIVSYDQAVEILKANGIPIGNQKGEAK